MALAKIAGSAIEIGGLIPYKTSYEASDFAGRTWTRISQATNIGDLGAEQAMITQTIIDNNTTLYAKGTLSFPIMTNTFAPLASDPGQMAFAAAQRACQPYAFRFVWGADCELISAVTISVADPAIVTWNDHGLTDGSTVTFSTAGTLPTGLTAGVVYYVVDAAANTFSVAATVGGAPIETTAAGSGTITATALPAGETDFVAGFALYGTKTGGDASAARLVNLPIQPIAPSVTV